MNYKLSEEIQSGIILFLRNILKIFPLKIRFKIFENLGLLTYYLVKARRLLTIDNIKHAFPNKSNKEIIEIAKNSYKTMGKMIMTTLYLKEIVNSKNTILENEDLMKQACNQDKGVIIVSLHYGGFEAGAIMNKIQKFYAVFRNQKNKKLNNLMIKFREEGNLNSIGLRETDKLNEVLKSKNIVALASDHYKDEIEITYFGRKTKSASGPILLSLKHKIPLVLSYVKFEGDKIIVINKEIINIEKQENLKKTIQFNMQKIYYKYEEIIKEDPGQYMWQHKKWRD